MPAASLRSPRGELGRARRSSLRILLEIGFISLALTLLLIESQNSISTACESDVAAASAPSESDGISTSTSDGGTHSIVGWVSDFCPFKINRKTRIG